jgi:hypothetical protein
MVCLTLTNRWKCDSSRDSGSGQKAARAFCRLALFVVKGMERTQGESEAGQEYKAGLTSGRVGEGTGGFGNQASNQASK